MILHNAMLTNRSILAMCSNYKGEMEIYGLRKVDSRTYQVERG